MAKRQPMVASTVVIPEDSLPEVPPRPPKRRQSNDLSADIEPKKPRIDTSVSAAPKPTTDEFKTPAVPSNASAPQDSQPPSATTPTSPNTSQNGRRRSTAYAEKERGRNKRLFGGLINTLATANTQRSAPAGKRLREGIDRTEPQKSPQVALGDKQTAQTSLKPEELKANRRREDRVWQREARETKWKVEKAIAGFMKTKKMPGLHWKPRRFFPEQKDRISTQIADASAYIAHEQEKFEKQHTQRKPDEAAPEACKDEGVLNEDQSKSNETASKADDQDNDNKDASEDNMASTTTASNTHRSEGPSNGDVGQELDAKNVSESQATEPISHVDGATKCDNASAETKVNSGQATDTNDQKEDSDIVNANPASTTTEHKAAEDHEDEHDDEMDEGEGGEDAVIY